MPTVAELLDQGVKAYTRGAALEAERCFSQALVLEPGNERARAYLRQLGVDARRAAGMAVDPAAGTAPPPPRPSSPAVPAPTAPFAHPVTSPWDDGPAAAPTIVIAPGTGLELGAVAETSGLRTLVPESRPTRTIHVHPEVDRWMEEARERFALGDFSGSLELIEKILRLDADHAEAREYLAQNEATLIAMYESKLGPLGGVPHLAISPEEVMWLNLDHRAGFLLAQVDGVVNYEELFALSGLPRLDTARILATLLADGVIRSD